MASFTVPSPEISPLLAASSRSRQKQQYIASFLRSDSKLNPPSMPGHSRNQSNVFKVCVQLNEVALERFVPPLDKVLAKEPKDQYEIPDASSISIFMNQVSDLIKLVDSRDISELQLKQMDCELVIRKKEALPQPSVAALAFSPTTFPPQLSPASDPSPASVVSVQSTPTSLPALAKPKSSHPPFKCPMAGSFYRSPAPGAPPFVKVGDKVQKGQVICIIEAMKLMNEIEADHSGTVVEILVDDGKPVSVDVGTGRAGKTLRIPQSGALDESGARHTKSRRVNALVRRGDRGTVRIHSPEGSLDYDRSSSSSASDDDTLFGTGRPGGSGREGAASGITRGPGGRFVSTGSSSSARDRAPEDIFVPVTEPLTSGPREGTVIPSFLGHVGCPMFTNREYRGELRCHFRVKACDRLTAWLGRLTDDSRQQIEATGLSHLPSMMYGHLDTQLISAFVERWQPDTNTFHMPFGEMTITLHDVWEILRIPVDDELVSITRTPDELKATVVELLMVPPEEMSAHWQGGGVVFDSIFSRCGGEEIDGETQAVAWMFAMFGATLFVDKRGSRVRPACLLEISDGLVDRDGFDIVPRHSWESAALAYLYRQLGIASRGGCTQIGGCLTLMQPWIYEYFPCFRPARERMVMRPGMPRAATWPVVSQGRAQRRLVSLRLRIDQLTASEVTWMPYRPDPASLVPRTVYMGWIQYRDVIEPYMPARVVRQFGYVQSIPPPIFRPHSAHRPWNSTLYKVVVTGHVVADAWNVFPTASALVLGILGRATDDPGSVSDDYILWYNRHSRPKLVNMTATPSIPPRSNTDYWVDRLARMQRSLIGYVEQLDAGRATESTRGLEDYMRDWSLSR